MKMIVLITIWLFGIVTAQPQGMVFESSGG